MSASEPLYIARLAVGSVTTVVTSTTEAVSTAEPVNPLRLWNQIGDLPASPAAFAAAFAAPAADNALRGVARVRVGRPMDVLGGGLVLECDELKQAVPPSLAPDPAGDLLGLASTPQTTPTGYRLVVTDAAGGRHVQADAWVVDNIRGRLALPAPLGAGPPYSLTAVVYAGTTGGTGGGGGTGDVVGPGGSTPDAVAVYASGTGKLLRSTGVTIDAQDDVAGIRDLAFTGALSAPANSVTDAMIAGVSGPKVSGALSNVASLTATGAVSGATLSATGAVSGSTLVSSGTLSVSGSATVGDINNPGSYNGGTIGTISGVASVSTGSLTFTTLNGTVTNSNLIANSVDGDRIADRSLPAVKLENFPDPANAGVFLDGAGNWSTPGGGGNVTGPGSAGVNAIARYATATTLADSGAAVDDDGRLTATNLADRALVLGAGAPGVADVVSVTQVGPTRSVTAFTTAPARIAAAGGGFALGDFVLVRGATTPANNGLFVVESDAGGVITISENPDLIPSAVATSGFVRMGVAAEVSGSATIGAATLQLTRADGTFAALAGSSATAMVPRVSIGADSAAVGARATATGAAAVAVGGNDGSGSGVTARQGARATGVAAVAIGANADATGAGAVALGGSREGDATGAQAAGAGAIAIGAGASAAHAGAVVIAGGAPAASASPYDFVLGDRFLRGNARAGGKAPVTGVDFSLAPDGDRSTFLMDNNASFFPVSDYNGLTRSEVATQFNADASLNGVTCGYDLATKKYTFTKATSFVINWSYPRMKFFRTLFGFLAVDTTGTSHVGNFAVANSELVPEVDGGVDLGSADRYFGALYVDRIYTRHRSGDWLSARISHLVTNPTVTGTALTIISGGTPSITQSRSAGIPLPRLQVISGNGSTSVGIQCDTRGATELNLLVGINISRITYTDAPLVIYLGFQVGTDLDLVSGTWTSAGGHGSFAVSSIGLFPGANYVQYIRIQGSGTMYIRPVWSTSGGTLTIGTPVIVGSSTEMYSMFAVEI